MQESGIKKSGGCKQDGKWGFRWFSKKVANELEKTGLCFPSWELQSKVNFRKVWSPLRSAPWWTWWCFPSLSSFFWA